MEKSSKNTKRPTPEKPTNATEAASWPLPKGYVVMDGKPESHIFVGGARPPKKAK